MSIEPVPDLLNPEQQEAVSYSGGPLLVFAGAGSGKTRVITHRIARILREGVPAHRILAVTFTNKAAREMTGRVVDLVGENARDMWIGTFHSLCARFLRIEGEAIGISRNFVIYDDADQVATIKTAMAELRIDDKSLPPRKILNIISHAKEQLLTPEQFAKQTLDFVASQASQVYARYAKKLLEARALDFDDLLFFANALLDRAPAVREKYQDRFLHVLVDEYQDVNLAQYKLIQTLSAKHRNVVVVGDDDQSIYAWRGADVRLILQFPQDYPDTKVITLERNYRSTRTILEAANAVISRNRNRAPKRLWTDNRDGTPIRVIQAGTERDEALMVADSILQDVQNGRRRLRDFAVLYRTNAQSRVIEEAFVQSRIPHLLVGGVRFYERREVRDMLAYLRVAFNPRDDAAFKRIANVPPRALGDGALEKISARAYEIGVGLAEAISDQALHHTLPAKGASGLRSLVDAFASARKEMETKPVHQVIQNLMDTTGYLKWIRTEEPEEAEARLENLQQLVNAAAQYSSEIEEPSVGGFLESVALMADIDQLKDQSTDKVTLMTLHSAKGLEFPVIYLVGLEEGVFPHQTSVQAGEVDEERRLCYVGMTRAREELTLCWAARRAIWGQARFNDVSRFMRDIPQELLSVSGPLGGGAYGHAPASPRMSQPIVGTAQVTERPKRESRPSDWTPPFQVGQKVKHAKFGIGLVVGVAKVMDDAEVSVVFPGLAGTKKLMQKFAKLEAV